VVAPGTLLMTGCDKKKQVLRWSIVGLEALKEVRPTLVALNATEVVELIDQALPYADKLKDAFESDDTTSAAQWLEGMLGVDGWMARIADKVGLLADSDRKTIILGSLATAQIFYRMISVEIKGGAPAADKAAMRAAAPKAAATIDRAAEAKAIRQAFEVTRF
jgi:hypothetical protein